MASPALPLGARIGILGGGQLGRMTALAAARLGYRTIGLAPETDPPLAHVTDRMITASYDDEAALAQFVREAAVITYEFENVPAATARFLESRVAVRPGHAALDVAQDRAAEKQFFQSLGIAVAPWHAVDSAEDACQALDALGGEGILKTRREGYDGKGQRRVHNSPDAAAAFADLGSRSCVLEGIVPFVRELSVIGARAVDGSMACYPLVQNEHENHILARTTAPAPGAQALQPQAETMVHRAMEALDMVGLLALELFETSDGQLLVNEMAPRPHNSGHWSMDGCATDQFTQFVRAVTGHSLGATTVLHLTTMHNLLGNAVHAAPAWLAKPNARLHLYGKTEARPGRKMGHVNVIEG